MYNDSNIPGDYGCFLIISFVAWFSILISAWLTFILPDRDIDHKFIVWLHLTATIDYDNHILLFAINIQYYIFYTIIILIYVILTIAFCTIIYSGFINRNKNVLNALLGNTTRFHFLPLFFITLNFVLGEILDEDPDLKDGHFIISIILTILALLSLIVISFQTKIELYFTKEMAIIKAVYSCFIAFLTYYLVYIIWYYKFYNDMLDVQKEEDIYDLFK